MHHERELFRRLVDETLSPEEFCALEERLLADRDFRVRFVRYMDLEASLYAELAMPAAEAPKARRRGGWGVPSRAMLGAVAVVLVVAVSLYRAGNTPRVQYAEVMLRGIEDAAIVTHVEGVAAQTSDEKPLRPGMRLKPGVLQLRQGLVQLEFLSGAKVLVQGPAELHILSPKSATLVSGQAAARVLQWGKGFVLNTRDAAFVDLGTEFAVGTDGRHGSELQVVDGEVEVSLIGEDGNTLVSERVPGSSGLRVRRGATKLEAGSGSGSKLPRILDEPAAPLRVPREYVSAVMKSRPLIYWRFETVRDGVVPNEAGSQWSARVHGSSGAEVVDGLLRFSTSGEPRYVAADEPLSELNAEAFTIELWVNADMLHWATVLGISPADDPDSVKHLNVIELAHRTSLVHAPGAYRLLHRHPPSRGGGVNVFTPIGCTPGQWHHLVAVKTPEELRLHFDGKLVRRLGEAMGDDRNAYRLLLGQLRPSTVERQFSGSIDEFALYARALGESEIQEHYQALKGQRIAGGIE